MRANVKKVMNKIFYFVIATIRIIGEFFATSPLVKKIVYYFTADTQTGIAARLWMAVLTSVAALLFNVFYLQVEFEQLPENVPLLFDINGKIAETGHKSMLNGYTEVRLAFFLIMVFIGWVTCKVKGGTLMAKRIRLLVIDIANLVITTCITMAAVYIEIAKGNGDEKLSEEWEYAVMGFWLLTLIYEFIIDKHRIQAGNAKKSST